MRFRCDKASPQEDGALCWYAMWMGGDTLAKIENCRLENLAGDMRRTVFITSYPDTFFSIPAECSIGGCTVKGYVTGDSDGNMVFRQVYY